MRSRLSLLRIVRIVCIGLCLGATSGCPTSRTTSRCVALGARSGGPAQLSPAAENPLAEPVRMSGTPDVPLRCNGKGPDGRDYLDDPVDDLTAVVKGAGVVDGQLRAVCPAFPTALTSEPPSVREPPCGASACPNRQYQSEAHGLAVHLLFYDDPGRRRPERAAELPSGACYYRLYAIAVSWDGKAAQ